jgi:hypothetical protein
MERITKTLQSVQNEFSDVPVLTRGCMYLQDGWVPPHFQRHALFIYCLYNGIVSISEYMASSGTMISNECKQMWREVIVA